MENFSTENASIEEFSPTHSKFIESVSLLDKKQRVKVSERSEPTLNITDFHLVKSGVADNNDTKVLDLIKTLYQKGRQTKISKILNTSKNYKVLSKLLEKPVVEKIKRTAGYECLKKDLRKWNSVIVQHRTAENVSFPLSYPSMKSEPNNDFIKRFRIQSDLEKELLLIEPSLENTQKENVLKLSLEEVLQRRTETAKFRAEQSYKMSKACRQKRIKSKKFHRIERKTRLKNKLKELVQLEKSDPDVALEKLKYLEKIRSIERMTLRHKNTGHWAKNKLIRAKYDRKCRQELTRQLSVGRNMTQKTLTTEDADIRNVTTASIPQSFSEISWINNKEPESEVNHFVNQYRTYYNNKINNKLEANEALPLDGCDKKLQNVSQNKIGSELVDPNETFHGLCADNKSKPSLKSKKGLIIYEDNVIGTSKWIVSNLDYLEANSVNSCERIDVESGGNVREKNIKCKDNKDERKNNNMQSVLKNNYKELVNDHERKNRCQNISKALKLKNLKSQLPDENSMECDLFCNNDDVKKENGYKLLYEAFPDEDLFVEFKKEKKQEVEKFQTEDVSLILPGWGRWGGSNIMQPSKRERKFIVEFGKDPARRDENKGSVIIHEESNSSIRKHQVKELPFPFMNVKDYESSMRAPVGRNFVPEKTHSRLIIPSFKTIMGKVIEPMDEDSVLNIQNFKVKENAK